VVKNVTTGQKNPSIHLPDTGSLKIMLDDYTLPDFENLKRDIMRAHQHARSSAIHCVTAVELVFAVSALREAGAQSGDRIEHGSLISDQMTEVGCSADLSLLNRPWPSARLRLNQEDVIASMCRQDYLGFRLMVIGNEWMHPQGSAGR